MIEIPLPDTVKVAGSDYRIDVSKAAQEELWSGHQWGCADHNRRVIQLCTGHGNPNEFSNTVLHEVIHAIDKQYFGLTLEEKTVAILANGLHQVFEDIGLRFVPRGE